MRFPLKSGSTTKWAITGLFPILLVIAIQAFPCFADQSTSAGKVQTIRVAMDNNYPPYVFNDEKGHLQGIIVDQWQLWEKKTGIRAELHGMDWEDAKRRMAAGEFDVIDTIFRNEEREKIYDFTKPYARLDVPLFFNVGISGIRDATDLKGFLVAAKSGDNVIDVLKKQGVTNIAEYQSYEQLVEAARDGKVKIFTVDRPPALYYLNKMGIQNQFRETEPLYSGEFHRAVAKGNVALLRTLESGFAAISQKEYQAIDTRWMGRPLSNLPDLKHVLYALAGIAAILGGLLIWLWALKRAIKSKTRELAASEVRYRTLVESSIDVIFVLDAAGVFKFVSPAWEKHFGYPVSEVIGREFTPFVHPDDTRPCADYLMHVMTTGQGATSPSYRVRHANGSWRLFIANGTPYQDAGGARLYLGIARDISDQKRAEDERLNMEKQLLHAQKLESLGVLAGGIAHDFNNILTAIIGNAELALMRLNPESPALENLHRIENAAARAADLAKQMLAYSGKGKFVIESIDMNRLVKEMGHMLEVSISKKAILRYDLAKQLPAVDVDATQIRQIIMNLVINASEAIGDRSGVIAISSGCLECDEAYLKDAWLTDQIPEGLYVSLEIVDTGCGMDNETQARIFDPFFTTKFTGRGLGMAAVLGILRGHKGAIKIHSVPGKGSSFKILLPAGTLPPELFNDEIGGDNWRGSGVVLLVDDEETVRAICGEMLRELGFEVVTASDGREALEKFKTRNDISVVILDLTMPHMDGEQCFRELRQLDPTVPVVMSSGFNEYEVTQKFAGMGLAGFVQKPYKISMLKEAIRKI